MKTNVKCMHCGKVFYNPNVPKEHVIDTCSDEKCIRKSSMSAIGFMDGDIQNCSGLNLYQVHPNVLKGCLDASTVISKDKVELNDKLATVEFLINQGNFGGASKILRDKTLNNNPKADFFRSKVFYKKQKNIAMGTKYLELAAIGKHPKAMAEYGYIICVGKYGKSKKVEEGIDLLLKAYNLNVYASGVYLAQVYKKGIYKDTKHDAITDEKWFEIVEFGALSTFDKETEMVLGNFYSRGIGCKVDIDLAIHYLKSAANDGYVLACSLLAHVYLYKFYCTSDPKYLDLASPYVGFYLDKAMHKEIQEYQEVLDLKEFIESELN